MVTRFRELQRTCDALRAEVAKLQRRLLVRDPKREAELANAILDQMPESTRAVAVVVVETLKNGDMLATCRVDGQPTAYTVPFPMFCKDKPFLVSFTASFFWEQLRAFAEDEAASVPPRRRAL